MNKVEIYQSSVGFWVSEDGRIYKEVNYSSRGNCKIKYNVFSFNGQKFDVHREVAKLFIPNPTNQPWVLHWDDNPLNNRVRNLRWGDAAQNAKDRVRNWSIKKFGHRIKLNKKVYPEIIKMVKNGMKYREIAEQFLISESRVSQIVKKYYESL
jgi:hypothetical protein